ncbi:MAG: hypothetical protein A2542_00910 [Parcubacteria group bacterium RIFOXYD2_FULL_52_8]|nr:MAG: hypothetical protein A2542_00910 [Parcubacteria group bacterium RIFOXYD2_FULL_52_8]
MLSKPGGFVHVYFPPDGNSMLAVLRRCLASKNEINIIVAGKTQEPRWLTPTLAEEELKRGLMTWDFASDSDPDLVLAAAGDYMTKEALAALSIVKQEAPEILLRFVNILELGAAGIGNQAHAVTMDDFEAYFTKDKPVIVNFHGYPQTLKQVLFDYGGSSERFSVHGYIENGSTTTPFDMQVRNLTDRYHLAIEVFEQMLRAGKLSTEKAARLNTTYEQKLREHSEYIRVHGVDPDDIELWQWKPTAL